MRACDLDRRPADAQRQLEPAQHRLTATKGPGAVAGARQYSSVKPLDPLPSEDLMALRRRPIRRVAALPGANGTGGVAQLQLERSDMVGDGCVLAPALAPKKVGQDLHGARSHLGDRLVHGGQLWPHQR